MLNPSTADAAVDDPTIRRCTGFARAWGYGGLSVVNLYALRAKNPADLKLGLRLETHDPVGPDNDTFLRDTFITAAQRGMPVIAAWGANATSHRVDQVAALAAKAGVKFLALGTTRHGAPRHPLYLRRDTEPARWVP